MHSASIFKFSCPWSYKTECKTLICKFSKQIILEDCNIRFIVLNKIRGIEDSGNLGKEWHSDTLCHLHIQNISGSDTNTLEKLQMYHNIHEIQKL